MCQNGLGILDMGFVYYRQLSLIYLMGAQFLGYHQKYISKTYNINYEKF